MSTSKLRLILDGDEANPVELGPIDSGYSFYGVAVDGSFTTFEFREVEGTLEDQKFIFADDFTVAIAAAANAPPRIPMLPGGPGTRGRHHGRRVASSPRDGRPRPVVGSRLREMWS